MARKVRAVVVGCGGMSPAWLHPASDRKGLEIVGLVDIRKDAALQRKEEFHLEKAAVGDDLRSMLKVSKTDVVFDCTVPEAHVSVALEAFRSGCHVLGEKPLADNIANAKKMVRAAERSHKLHAVMQNHRYGSNIRGFRKFLASGRIGHLTNLYGSFFRAVHVSGWRTRMKHSLLVDMGIHTFDGARFLSGANALSVYCKEWNPKHSWFAHGGAADAVFEMTGGLVYSYRGCWCAEGRESPWEAEWLVIGERGSASWDGAEDFKAHTVKKSDRGGSQVKEVKVAVPKRAPRDKHEVIIGEFLRCLRSGGTPETASSDNIKSLAMVFAATESAETGRTVKIDV